METPTHARYDFTGRGVFTAGEVSSLLDIPRRRVLLYVEEGTIKPSVPSAGQGRANGFSFLDLVRFALVSHLEQFGIAPRHMSRFVSELPDISDKNLYQLDGENITDVVPTFVIFSHNAAGRLVITTDHSDFSDKQSKGYLLGTALWMDRFIENRVSAVVNFKALFEDVQQRVERRYKGAVGN